MAVLSPYETSRETPLESAIAQATKKDALNRAVLDAQRRLGRLLLEGPTSPELAAMVTLLILKVHDLQAELAALPGPVKMISNAPQFAEF